MISIHNILLNAKGDDHELLIIHKRIISNNFSKNVLKKTYLKIIKLFLGKKNCYL